MTKLSYEGQDVYSVLRSHVIEAYSKILIHLFYNNNAHNTARELEQIIIHGELKVWIQLVTF